MQLPTYQCRQALEGVNLRDAITALAECFPTATEVQDIANEAIPCKLGLEILLDIFNREVNAALCFLAAGGALICDRPDPCDCYTVTTPSISGSLDIWDTWMKCATFPDTVTISGHLTTSAAGIYNQKGGSMSFLTSLSFPALIDIATFVFIAFQETLNDFSAPLLQTVATDFQIGSNANQRSLEIPSLVSVGGNFITSGTLYPSLSVPLLTTVGGILMSIGGLALTDVDISSLTNFDGDFECVNSALTQSAVNHILIVLDSQVVLSGAHNVLLNAGSSASPSGAGITAKNNLIGRGVAVNTN